MPARAPAAVPVSRDEVSATPRLGSVGLVALCVLFTLALRVPYLGRPLLPDEAGLLIIAQNWAEGPYLYGDYFVGRGIVLVLVYALADLLGGASGVRVVGAVVAAGMVMAAGWAGHLLRGRAGAGWAALAAAAYSSTYALASEGMNERLMAAAFVMLSCALTLAAVRRPHASWLAVGAGVMASLPVLVVQSYVDAWVFAAVVLVVGVRAGRLALRDAVRVAAGGLVGLALTTAALLLGIATTWMTLEQLWFQLVQFRVAASLAVVESTDAPGTRFLTLLVIASSTGILLLLAAHAFGRRALGQHAHLRPVWLGVVGMVVLSVASMVAGGDWWADYLLQLVPALALAAALAAPSRAWSSYVARIGACLAAVAAVTWQYVGIVNPVLGTPTNEAAVGRWLAAAGEADDEAVVIWGKANVLQSAEMTSPYPYLWSLIVRTLDPELERIVATLSGPEAPTWVVVWHDVDSWGLDEEGLLGETLHERYAPVGAPCGADVYLLRGEERDVLPEEACGDRTT